MPKLEPLTTMSTIRLMIVDDHEMFVEALTALFRARDKEPEINVVATTSSAPEAMRLLRVHQPNVVILDAIMPVMDGFDVAAEIKRRQPDTKVIILSAKEDSSVRKRAEDYGADGYFGKKHAFEALISVIERVMRDEKLFDYPRICRQDETLKPNITLLSRRELQILKLIVEGKKNKEISSLLSRSIRTIEAQRANLLKKLGKPNFKDLMAVAQDLNLLD